MRPHLQMNKQDIGSFFINEYCYNCEILTTEKVIHFGDPNAHYLNI
jgi:hypothetical protein